MRIVLAGEVEVVGVAGPVAPALLSAAQTRAALALLVLERHAPIPRDVLAELLWPHRLPASWAVALRGVVARVRGVLVAAGADADAVTAAAGSYHVRLPAGAVVDVEHAQAAFERAVAALAGGAPADASALAAEAAAIAGRRLLPGAEGAWLDERRDALRALHVRALAVAGKAQLQSGEGPEALASADALLAVDRLSENGHRLAIAAHGLLGDGAAATRALDRCRELLFDELGIEPSAATVDAWRRAIATSDEHAGAQEPAIQATPAGGRAPEHRVRRQQRLADLAGRDDERAEALLALAAALREAGRHDESVRTVRAVAELARARANPQLLARATLSVAGHRRIARRADPLLREFLDESLALLGDSDPELQARLLAALSEQLAVDGELPEARRASRAAAAAVGVGHDPAVEAEIVASSLAALGGPRQAAERLAESSALYGELRDASGTVPAALAVAAEHRIHALVELGEWAAACRAMDDYRARAEVAGPPNARWVAAQHTVCRAVVLGRLRAVDALVHATREHGARAVGREIANAAADMHLLVPRWLEGRLAELAADTKRFAARLGWPPRSRAARAMIAADSDEARRALDSVMRRGGFAALPVDAQWPATVFYLLAALRRMPIPAYAQEIRCAIEPLIGRDASFVGIVHYGAYAHHAAITDAICGDLDQAGLRLRAAIEHYDAIGAPLWSALATADLTRLARDGPVGPPPAS